MLDKNEHARWVNDNGDYTHNITYNLTENSVIMDLGGYTGVWAQQMIEKYNPYVYILEPVTNFYEGMVTKFSNNNKVRLMNVGIGTENKDGFIFIAIVEQLFFKSDSCQRIKPRHWLIKNN